MTLRSRLVFWSAAFAVFLLIIWLFKSVLFPFILGMAIAYFLNPIAEKLAAINKMPRRMAVLSILGIFILAFLFLLALITPMMIRETTQLIEQIPNYTEKGQRFLAPYLSYFRDYLTPAYEEELKNAAQNHAGTALNIGKNILGSLVLGGQAFINFMTLLFVTPLVAYFMLQEWPAITQWVEDLMPKESASTIKNLLQEIDKKISGFVRGQLTVAATLGLFYAIALSVAGLKYGVLIGLTAGVLSIIPMLGSIIGLITALLVAWLQGGDLAFVSLTAGIFIFGQLVEGNLLTPKLVGDSVGLHPLWIIFALMAGGAMLGILGMFLAVPVAASIGVLGSFGLMKYKGSVYYTGQKTTAKNGSKRKTATS